MRAEDLLIANLETAVTERGEPWPKTYRFRVSPALIDPLKDSGIDLVSLTNNHVFDYRETGFLDTLDNLKAGGLPYVGAGKNFAEAAQPWAGTVRGEELRVWALGDYPVERTGFSGAKDAAVQRGKPGILWADERALSELARQFKELDARFGVDGVCKIVVVHAGTEYEGGCNALQRELYHRLVNMGADIVIGHHPHVLEPIEWYQGAPHAGLIAYSLGNYLFDGMNDIPRADESVLLSIKIERGRAVAIRLDGVLLTGPSLKLDASGAIVKRLLAMSPTVRGMVEGVTSRFPTAAP
jgi:poly-gamma-glutamate synthesis protein (capsule biosynthesis protein)